MCRIYHILIVSFMSSVISAAQDCDPYGFGGTPCSSSAQATADKPTETTPPKPVQPTTPTDVSLPITIPIIGTINLIPFTDTTQTPAVTGFSVKITKPNEKLTIGPATIDDGQVSLIGDKLGMTGRLTIFGKQARFGIKDINFSSSQKKAKIIQRLVLTATFLPDSPPLSFGGITLPLGNVDITLEQGKSPIVQTHLKADTLTPFAATNIPVLNTLKFTNLDVQLDVTKTKNNKLTPTVVVKGDTEILGVKVNTVIKEVVDQNGKPGIYVNAPLPKNWKFSDSIKELKGTFFDGLIFNEAWLIACSVDYNDPDKNITIKKGLSFYAQLPLSGSLASAGKLLGSTDQTFTMYGKIDPNPHNINLGIIVSQGNPINTAKVSVGNTQVILSGEPHVGVKANIIVHPSTQDTLTFAGEFDLQPTTATLNASMDGTWNNPFGIKGFILHDVALKLGIQYLPPPPKPTLIGIAAGMQIKNNTINFASVADATLQHMALQGHIDRLSFMDIVTSFAQPMGLKLPQPAFPLFDLTNVDVRFAATDTTIGNQTIAQGITMIADMNVLNEKANVQVNVGGLLDGIKIFGSVDPINIANILKIDGRNGADKPKIDIELSLARQNFLIQGELSLANLYKTATYIAITTAGIEFDFVDSINNNTLLYSHVHGQSSGSLNNPQFQISIDFEQHLQQYIKDRVTDQFAIAQHQVVDSINAAQRQVDTLKQVKADAQKKIDDARNKVKEAEQSLDAINKAIADSNKAFDDAQNNVNTIQHEIDELKQWYNSLPVGPSAHGYTYSLFNNTPWIVNVCLSYHGESIVSCRSDCWVSIKPGERHDFPAGVCCIKNIIASTINRPNGKIENNISPTLCGDGVWEISSSADKKRLTINEVSKRNLFDNRVSRGPDYAARRAALEGALIVAKGVLSSFKELSSGTLTASKATAEIGMHAAQEFLHGVEQAAHGVLQLSDDTAQGVLQAAQQTGVGILQGGTWIANQTLSQFDITKIHYDGNLQDLSKGVLGNVLVEAQIIKPIQLHFSLDPKNIAGSVNAVLNQLTDALKHAFIDPLTPKLNQVKANAATITKAEQSLVTLKPAVDITQAQAAANSAKLKIEAATTRSQLDMANTQKSLLQTKDPTKN